MQIIAKDYRNGQPLQLEINYGCVTSMQSYNGEQKDLFFVAPGMLDLQINGYHGIDFNTADLTSFKINQLVELLWKQGVTSFFPTVITNAPEQIKQALRSIANACNENDNINQSISGIHLEGPFISTVDGPRGAHDSAFVMAPDWELFSSFQEAAEGKIKLITLSPEWPGADEFIRKSVSSGVKVAIGHTAANTNQIEAAISAGATLSTHLGNASHLQLPRHPNYIWDQLAADHLWMSLIADGFHLPDSVLKVFLKVKPQKSFLVSDLTRFGGLSPGVYETHIGGKVELNEEGKLFMHHSPGLLAGSAQSLLDCVNYLIRKSILPLDEAWNMASLKPASFLLGKSITPFTIHQPADLVLFRNGIRGVEIVQTIKAGKKVFDII